MSGYVMTPQFRSFAVYGVQVECFKHAFAQNTVKPTWQIVVPGLIDSGMSQVNSIFSGKVEFGATHPMVSDILARGPYICDLVFHPVGYGPYGCGDRVSMVLEIDGKDNITVDIYDTPQANITQPVPAEALRRRPDCCIRNNLDTTIGVINKLFGLSGSSHSLGNGSGVIHLQDRVEIGMTLVNRRPESLEAGAAKMMHMANIDVVHYLFDCNGCNVSSDNPGMRGMIDIIGEFREKVLGFNARVAFERNGNPKVVSDNGGYDVFHAARQLISQEDSSLRHLMMSWLLCRRMDVSPSLKDGVDHAMRHVCHIIKEIAFGEKHGYGKRGVVNGYGDAVRMINNTAHEIGCRPPGSESSWASWNEPPFPGGQATATGQVSSPQHHNTSGSSLFNLPIHKAMTIPKSMIVSTPRRAGKSTLHDAYMKAAEAKKEEDIRDIARMMEVFIRPPDLGQLMVDSEKSMKKPSVS